MASKLSGAEIKEISFSLCYHYRLINLHCKIHGSPESFRVAESEFSNSHQNVSAQPTQIL